MSGERRQASSGTSKSTTRGVDRAIATICRRQRQLVTLDQLYECGLSGSGVRSRVTAGRLHRVHHKVFCLHPHPLSRRQRFLAAVIACGPGTCLSDLSAVSHHGMAETPPKLIHVSNRSRAGRTLSGIVVHCRTILRRDVQKVDGIWCTSPARTIVDCATSVTQDLLEDLLMAADAKRSLDRTRLEELIAERRGQPGMRKLRELITGDPAATRSVNERRMLKICHRFGASEPLVNHPIRVGERLFYADFCWPELGLIVEADSWRWHGGRLAGESDADRDQILSMAGWRVVHFTRNQIKREVDRTGRRLLVLTSGRRLARGDAI